MTNIVPSGNNKINVNSNISGPSGNYNKTIKTTRFGPNSKTYPGMIADNNKNTEEYNFSNFVTQQMDNFRENCDYADEFLNSVNSINRNNLNNISTTTIDVNNEETKTESKYSNTEHSDMDNININQLRTIMVNFQNMLNNVNPSYYNYFCNYCEGKKLSDIIDENGYIRNINFEEVKPVNFSFLSFLPEKFRTNMENFINKNKENSQNNNVNGINQIINNSREDLRITGLSTEMLNSTIEEVVFNDSGYDAFVLKHPNGNYMIVNSSTNSESIEDLAAIIYPLAFNIFGNTELLDFLFESVLVNLDIPGISEQFLNIVSIEGGLGEYCSKIYNNQMKDCVKLIEKYNEEAGNKGVQLELYGFSLGGGIMATAYQQVLENSYSSEIRQYKELLEVYAVFHNDFIYMDSGQYVYKKKNEYINSLEFEENKIVFEYWYECIINSNQDNIMSESEAIDEFYKKFDEVIEKNNEISIGASDNTNIASVTLYNPFMLFLQEYSGNGIGIDFTKLITNERFLIYSSQLDFVSLFYDHVEDFLGRTVYVPAGEVKPININNFNFNEIFKIIIGSSGNHGYMNIDTTSFDKNGNLQNEGEFIGINDYIKSVIEESSNEFVGAIVGGTLLKDKYRVSKDFLINSIFMFGNSVLSDSLGDNAVYAENIINDIKNYVLNNYGHYSYFGFCDILSNSIADTVIDVIPPLIKEKIVPDEADDIDVIVCDIFVTIIASVATDLFDHQVCKKSFYTTLRDNKDQVQLIISLRISGDKEEYNKEVKLLISKLSSNYTKLLEDKLDNELNEVEISFLGFKIYGTNALRPLRSNLINEFIKDKIIDFLEKTLLM